MVDVCIDMLVKTILGFCSPDGSFRYDGRHSDVLSSTLSMLRCRFQNSPFMSLSRSSASGRWRWTRLRPKRQAKSTMPPNGESLPTPAGFIDS